MNRRDFLALLAAGAAAGALPAPLRCAMAGTPDAPVAVAGRRSALLSVYHQSAASGRTVYEKVVQRMLNLGLSRFAGVPKPADAWPRILKGAQKVLIKFNRAGAEALNTTPALLKMLLASLAASGYRPDQVMLLDVTAQQQRDAQTHPPILGWQAQPVQVLGRPEHLSAALDWADAVVNVPFMKDHHLAGVTGAMKNLSHGLIKSPANWHADRCCTAIAHFYALPQISAKVRLHLCNGLRVMVDGGPDGRNAHIIDHRRLLFSADPVAIDAYAYRLIDHARATSGLKDLAEDKRPPTYLTLARTLNLGQCDLDHVDITELECG